MKLAPFYSCKTRHDLLRHEEAHFGKRFHCEVEGCIYVGTTITGLRYHVKKLHEVGFVYISSYSRSNSHVRSLELLQQLNFDKLELWKKNTKMCLRFKALERGISSRSRYPIIWIAVSQNSQNPNIRTDNVSKYWSEKDQEKRAQPIFHLVYIGWFQINRQSMLAVLRVSFCLVI